MLRNFAGYGQPFPERKRRRTYRPMVEVLESRTLLTLPGLEVSAPGGVFDGSPYAAAAAVAGEDGVFGPSLEGVSPTLSYFVGSSAAGTPLAGAPSGAGTYTVVASFAGSADYDPTSLAATFVIAQATPVLEVNDAGGVFDSRAFAATATVAGIDGKAGSSLESVSPTLMYFVGTAATGAGFSAAPADAGTYTAVASFPGSADYSSAAVSTTFTIGPAYYLATATISIVDQGGTYSGAAFAASATIAGVGADDVPAAELEGEPLTLTYYAGSGTTGTALVGAPVNAGEYTVVASFPGSTDYYPASAATIFTIGQATPIVQVGDGGGIANGSAYPAVATVAGVNGVLGGTLEGVSPTLTYFAGTSVSGTPLAGPPVDAGTYTVLATFAGSTDYGSASATATFSIQNVTPTLLVSDAGGVYDGSAFTATATVGVDDNLGASLEGVSPTVTYFSGSSATGTPLAGAPVSAGTYTALATFPGSADYSGTSAATTFTITPATPTVQVSDGGGIFNGAAFAASATVAGISGGYGASLEGVSPTFTYFVGSSTSGTPLSNAPVNVGAYTVLAIFAGSTDYAAASATATFSISPATPTVQVSDADGVFDEAAFAATAMVAGVNGGYGASLEGVSPTITYYAGPSASGTSLTGAPVNVGTYSVLANFAGSTDYAAVSASTTFSISTATPAVQVSDGGGAFDGAAFAATATVAGVSGGYGASLQEVSPKFTYYAGSSASGTPLAGAPVNVGSYTVLANFAGSTDYAAASATTTFSISRATPTVQVSDIGGVFDGAAYSATATVAGVGGGYGASLEGISPTLTYFAGSSVGATPLSGAPVDAGTYAVLANFVGSTDYAAASATTTFTITSAALTVQVSDGGGVFDGAVYSATATVTGVSDVPADSLEGVSPALTYYAGATPLAGAPVNAGSYTVVANFAGSVDYTAASATTTFNITRATPTLQVSAGSGSYTGSPFSAAATIAGVSGGLVASLEGVTPTLTYYAGGTALAGAPTGVGAYTVLASFAGSPDYTAASATTTFSIGKAAPTVDVNDAGGTYGGGTFPAAATVAGVSGGFGSALEGVAPILIYYAGASVSGAPLAGAPETAGAYTVVAAFAGSADYTAASATATFNIAQATPTVQVNDAGGVFDGSAYPATTTVAGVSGGPGPSLEGASPTLTYYAGSSVSGTPLARAPVNVGIYTVLASFAGSTDFAAATAMSTFSITKAAATVQVSDGGGVYSGTAFAATATVAGVGGIFSASLEGASPTLTYYAGSVASGTPLAGVPVNVGTYTVLAFFAGSTDYTAASATTTFSISTATPTVQVTDSGGVYNAVAFPATATLAGVNGVFGTALEGASPTLTYYAGSVASGTPLAGAPVNVGTYTVLASFAGSTDYTTASALTTFSITKATPTVQVSASGGIYSGTAFAATALVAGIGGGFSASLEGASPTLTYYAGSSASGTPLTGAPMSVGTYTVQASFAGSTDYTAASATTTFSISIATPTVEVSDSGGIYNAAAFPATATVMGVNGVLAASLEGATPTLTYYSGTSASGTPLAGVPVNVGTYTALATFPGSSDYPASEATITFSISAAVPSVEVSDGGGIYTGTTFPATATVAGVSGGWGASLEGVSPTLTYYTGSVASGTPLPGAPVNVGTYTVLASFAGSTDYVAAVATATYSISKATPTVQVSDGGGVYSGVAFPATTTLAGVTGVFGTSLEGASPTLAYFAGASVSGTPLAGAPVNVGTYTVLATFAGSTDYTTASATTTFGITNAVPTVQVSDAGGVYDGAVFPAAATVLGVSGVPGASLEGVSPTFTYYAGSSASGTPLAGAPVNVGTYTVLASFAGSSDYGASGATATFSISAAVPTVEVSDGGGIYTGTAFPATATVAGVNGVFGTSLEGASPTFTYYAGSSAAGTTLASAPVNVGTYTVLASFAGSTDYTAASATTTFSIAQATPTVQVSDAGGAFDTAAFPATATVAGVGGGFGTSLEAVSPTLTYYAGSSAGGTLLAAAPVDVGTYTVLASFAGSTDYTVADASTTFSIAKATPTVQLTDSGGPFTGSPYPAAATITGASGQPGDSLEGVSPTLTYYAGSNTSGAPLSVAPVNPGDYTVIADFLGSSDYNAVSTALAFSITDADVLLPPELLVSDADGIFDGSSFPASVSITGENGQAGPSLEGVAPSLTYFSGNGAVGTPLAGAPIAAGTYTVQASFAGSADYAAATATATFTIAKALPTLQAIDSGGTYSGNAFTGAALISGGNGPATTSLESVTPSLTYFAGSSATGTGSATAPTSAGTYTVVATFAGSQDYVSASAAATFTIAAAAPLVHVSDSGGTYNGKAFPATATVAGVNGQPNASLESVTPKLVYFAGVGGIGTGSSAAPIRAGTYTVVASFAGSADYASAAVSVTFTIAPAAPKLLVSDTGGTFNAKTFPAATSIAGITGSYAATLEGIAPKLTYFVGSIPSGTGSSVAPVSAGTYSVIASFAGSADYAPVTALAVFAIVKATPTLTVTDNSGTSNGQPFTASTTIAGVTGVAGTSLEGVTPTVAYYASGVLLPAAPSAAGVYSAVASFAGSSDYSSDTATAQFVISPSVPAKITLVAGNNQTAQQYFSTPLAVLVTDPYGNPVPSALVTFTVIPGSNAVSGLFEVPLSSNSLYSSYVITTTTTVTTNAAGLAIAPPLTTNGYAGAFTVIATVESFGQVYSFVFTEYAL